MEELVRLSRKSSSRKSCYNCGHDHYDTLDSCANVSCPCQNYQVPPSDLPYKSPHMDSKVSRRTITLGKEIEAELRKIQAEMLMSTKRNVSFSQVLNELLKESLRLRSEQYVLR